MLPENGVFGNFDPGASMLTPQTNFHFSEPRKLKSPKKPKQNRMSSPKTLKTLPKKSATYPKSTPCSQKINAAKVAL
jgi:hypothetical protein